jgi:hypothetical protein
MRGREWFLLVVTVIGFVIPNVMVGMFIVQEGGAPADYIAALTTTLPATQFTIDLVICSVAFLGWTFWDRRRSGVRWWWVIFPATFLVGLCFAIPLYLLMRERALRLASA